MFLFILESLGTQELILIAVVSLIFLGPRRMPEMARKIGKILADLRKTTGDFRETWEREVNFDEEIKAFRIDDDDPKPISRDNALPEPQPIAGLAGPMVKQVDASVFQSAANGERPTADTAKAGDEANDKRNWL